MADWFTSKKGNPCISCGGKLITVFKGRGGFSISASCAGKTVYHPVKFLSKAAAVAKVEQLFMKAW
jgi:hypothetical protein